MIENLGGEVVGDDLFVRWVESESGRKEKIGVFHDHDHAKSFDRRKGGEEVEEEDEGSGRRLWELNRLFLPWKALLGEALASLLFLFFFLYCLIVTVL